MAGVPVNSVDDAKKVCQILLDKGCNVVLLTMGEKGCVIQSHSMSSDTPRHVPSRKVKAVDTTVSNFSL